MRRFFAGLMIGLIVLTGAMPVTPHDDFGSGHTHAETISGVNIASPIGDSSDNQDDRNVIHCNGIAHFFTMATVTVSLKSIAATQSDWRVNDVVVTHITAPATPPPIS